MTIEFPANIVPNGAIASIVDRGGVQRGASALRVDRLGNHYRAAMTLPPLDDEDGARVVVSRLIRAKRQGLRVPYPLLSVDQSGCGNSVVVDGAGQTGGSIRVRGLPPFAVVREGFWFSIESSSGQHYLHNSGSEVTAGIDGRATLSVADTLLRRSFADGVRVHLTRPMIEGLIDGSQQDWELAVDHFTRIEFTIEEAA